MPIASKAEIAASLEEVAALLELKGENPFRVRAYQNAARLVETSEDSVAEFLKLCSAGKVKGIGERLAEDIEVFSKGGTIPLLKELRAAFPEELLELFRIPGLGPKKIKTLYEELQVDGVSALEAACTSGKLAELKGFGAKTQQNILQGIERYRQYSSKFLFSEAHAIAETVYHNLKQSKLSSAIEIAGSLRRRKEIVGDIDIVACSDKPAQLMEVFVHLPQVKSITSHGETKSAVILQNGLAADLRVVSEPQFFSALQYFSGSKEHNIQLRAIAQKNNLKLNEYGLFRGERALPIQSEEDLYHELGLAFVPPEAREGLGEVEFAAELFKEKKSFPKLVSSEDILGILHAHSTYSDGVNSLRDMALKAKELGYQYLGITDHSQSAAYARGLLADTVRKQLREITKLNEELAPFRIFRGIESDILADGALDYPDTILAEFDFIIASVHSRFSLSRTEMTKRIVRAVENPYTTILGHATGRLLLERESYDVDLDIVLQAAKQSGTAVEINANPHRLDLDWRYVRKAKALGILLPICPDAHSIDGFKDIEYGVGIARKGLLTKENVLNAKSAIQIAKYFEERRK